MKPKSLLISALFLFATLSFLSCGNNSEPKDEPPPAVSGNTTGQNGNEVHGTEIKPSDVQMTKPLNAQWVSSGKAIYEMKCQSCHSLDENRIVGPGWKGVTKKREPHWIMNMITNVDMMLEKDPEAQKLLEQCLVRMPNQNITKDESRQILEFMRQNDGEK